MSALRKAQGLYPQVWDVPSVLQKDGVKRRAAGFGKGKLVEETNMSMTDSIADLLTRVRNANKAALPSTTIPYSRFGESVVKVLCDEGYLKGFEVVGEGIRKSIVVAMKYTARKEKAFEGLVKVSKPGRRVYVGCNDIRPVKGGMGVAIISTPKGVMTDATAKKEKVGGEWICSVW